MIVNHDYRHDSRVLYTFAPKAKMIFSDIYISLEDPNSTTLLLKDHYEFDQRNPRTPELSRYILDKVSSFLKSEQFREKVEREKGKILSGLEKSSHDGKNDDDDDDDDEFDDNDDCVYRHSEGKVIPIFKTRADSRVKYLRP